MRVDLLRRCFGGFSVRRASSVLTLTLACGLGSASFAAALPAGSYQKSCRAVFDVGQSLQAECRKKNGNWNRTWLWNFTHCNGNIGNNDGILACNRTGILGVIKGGPPGSYKASCFDIHMITGTLFAICKKKGNHGYKATKFLANVTCAADIANIDGSIRCMGP